VVVNLEGGWVRNPHLAATGGRSTLLGAAGGAGARELGALHRVALGGAAAVIDSSGWTCLGRGGGRGLRALSVLLSCGLITLGWTGCGEDGAPGGDDTELVLDTGGDGGGGVDLGTDVGGSDSGARDAGGEDIGERDGASAGDSGGGSDGDGDGAGGGEDVDAAGDAREGLAFEMSVVENPRSTLSAIVSIETGEPVRVAVRFWRDGGEVVETSRTEVGTAHEVTVVGMRASTAYTLQAVAYSGSREVLGPSEVFEAGSLPSGFPAFEVDVIDEAAVSDGVTMLGFGMGGGIAYFGVDTEGEVVWYYAESEIAQDRTIEQLADGSLLIATPEAYRIITAGGETVASYDPPGNVRLHHDAQLLPNGNLLALRQRTTTVNVPSLGGEVQATGDVIIEIEPSGEVVWQWDSFDHLDTTRFPGELARQGGRGGAYDWTHTNALVYLEEEDAILASLRHQSWIIKIDRATGEVLWRLGEDGDFELTAGDWFYNQHAPEVQADGSLLIYDNGNERGVASPYSRAVVYALDYEAMEATQTWKYVHDTFTSFLGDANRLPNGNVLVCAGGVMGRGGQPEIVEVTGEADPERVWVLEATQSVYRAVRIGSFYP
jgi:hypothetical protein